MTGKKLDPFWQYTKKIGANDFSCTFCQRHFRGGVSVARFKSHLAGETRCGSKVCDKVPNNVRSDALQAIIHASKLKKNKSPVSPNNVEECAIISHPSSSTVKGAHQSTTVPRKICKKLDKCLVNRKLAKFILSIGVPSNVIRSPSFIDLANSLAECGPGYEVPSRMWFNINSIRECKEDVAKYVAEVLRPLAETGCTLILDIWTDCYCTEDFLRINIFVYTPKDLVLETSFKCSSSVDVNVNIRDLKIGPVIHIIFPDTATCASREIELILQHLFEWEWMEKTLRLARSLFNKYLKKHDKVYYQIKGYESDELNYSASSFLKLQAVLKDEKGLKASHLHVASVSNEDYSSIIRSSEFWRDGKELVQGLQPIFQVLNLVSGHMSTSGYLYEAFQMAKAKIEKCLHQNQDDRYKPILEQFEKLRMRTIQPIHMAAALLNPDYKLSEDLKDNEIELGINYMLEKLVASEEKEVFRIQLDRYRTLLRPVFRSKTTKIEVHPRIWWEKSGDTFPVLRKYAIQILSQPCSTFSCHRYRWKHVCCSVNDYKSGVNRMLMEKYSMSEAGDEEPIDLDKLSGSPKYDDNQDLDIDEEPIDFDLLSVSSEYADNPGNQDSYMDDSEVKLNL